MQAKHLEHAFAVGEGYVLDVDEFRGETAGPTAALIAGVHGDEDEGILALGQIIEILSSAELRGVVKVVRVANPPAYHAAQRETPLDGLNLARVFPGSKDGSITERIADAITRHVIEGADVVVDLHSAGRAKEVLRFCGYVEDGSAASKASAGFARAFGLSPVWEHTVRVVGRTLSVAQDLGIPAIYAEMPGGGKVRNADLASYVEGTLNVLSHAGILTREQAPRRDIKIIRSSTTLQTDTMCSPCHGMMVSRARVGEEVRRGDVICDIYDWKGRKAAEIAADDNGIVVMLQRYARVRIGDLLATIAPAPIAWE